MSCSYMLVYGGGVWWCLGYFSYLGVWNGLVGAEKQPRVSAEKYLNGIIKVFRKSSTLRHVVTVAPLSFASHSPCRRVAFL